MEFIGHILLGLFVALVIALAFFTGMALLVWFGVAAMVVAAVLLLRELWYRCRFLYWARHNERPPRIIDGEYKDVSDDR